jgi:putative DNA primase/helicase
MLVLPNNSTWLATGNNLRVKGDLVRRSMRSFLDPGVERPEERTFAIKDLRAHVLAHRESILRDILTIARSRHLSGYVGPSYGSFESWAYWVRDTLIWLGMADPVQSQQALREGDQTDAWRRFLECVYAIWSTKEFTPRDIQEAVMGVRRFGGPSEAYSGLSTVVSELVKDINNVAQIGSVMQSWGTRVVGGYRLAQAPRAMLRGPTYRVERPEDTAPLVQKGGVANVVSLGAVKGAATK